MPESERPRRSRLRGGRDAEALTALADRAKAERQVSRRKRRRTRILLMAVAGLLVLASIPYLVGQFRPDPEARRQQELITAALEQVRVGMTLPEVNRLFNRMHTPPRASIALQDAQDPDSAVFTAPSADGSVMRFAFDTSAGFLETPYIAVVVFPKTRQGPPPTFIIFSAQSASVLAVTEVECARAMQIVSEAPLVPEEAYQEAPIRPKRNDLVSDDVYDVWMSGRAILAHDVAATLRCVPSGS